VRGPGPRLHETGGGPTPRGRRPNLLDRSWRDPATPLPRGTERRALDGREYLVTQPADRIGPHGLILNLHGLTSNLVQQLTYSRLAEHAPARGYVVVTPQGSGRVPHWVIPPLPGDDARFLRAVLDAVTAQVPVDPARRFATGISNGAAMAMALAQTWPGYFAAVAPVAGVNAIPMRPVADVGVCAFHGTADRVVPFEGGALFAGFRSGAGPLRQALARRRTPRVQLPRVEDALAGFARANGVMTPPLESRLGADVLHEIYAESPRLELFTVLGGGHTWPGSADSVALLGTTTRTVDATTTMLDRFDRVGQA
jgi:polyhydroxybutyrate depolymerase